MQSIVRTIIVRQQVSADLSRTLLSSPSRILATVSLRSATYPTGENAKHCKNNNCASAGVLKEVKRTVECATTDVAILI